MVLKVDFVSLEDSDEDIIVSFAIPDDLFGVKSLILHRTLFCEEFLPDNERGVHVSLDGKGEQNGKHNMLESIEISGKIIKIKATFTSHSVDVSKVDLEDISNLKALVKKQNYDDRFSLINN